MRISILLLVIVSFSFTGRAESHRNWKEATLVAAERRDDAPEMEHKRETTTTTDIYGNDQTTTTTKVEPNGLQRLWMYYTIQSDKVIYVTRIGVNLPWTKRITAEAGSTIKYAVDGKKLYVLNEDGSEARSEIMATRMATLTPHPPTSHPPQP